MILKFPKYRVGHSELKRHVKPCYFLSTDFVFTKIHMGIVQNLMDKNIPKNFDSASNWPQEKLSSHDSQKYIKPMSKKGRIFVGFSSNFFSLQHLFLWLQKVVLDLIYWI